MAASGTKEGDLKACEFTCNNCGGGNIVEEGMIYGRLATMKLSTNACSKTNYELK